MSKKRSSTQTSSIDPFQRQIWGEAWQKAKDITSRPYQAYEGDTVAGFTGDQQAAFDMARAGALGGVGSGALNLGMAGTLNAMGYQPGAVQTQFRTPQVSSNYGPASVTGPGAVGQVQTQFAPQRTGFSAAPSTVGGSYDVGMMDSNFAAPGTGFSYQASQVGGPSMVTPERAAAAAAYTPERVQAGAAIDRVGDYMNPFLQNVAGNVVSELDRARQIQMNQGAASARAAGAFGGSRHGVADSLTNEAFFRNAGNTLSSLYSQGYDSALNAANVDLNRNMQGQLANQAAGLQAGLQNQQLGTQANVLNANNYLQAALQNQQLGQQAQQLNQAAGLQAAGLNLNAAQSDQSAAMQAQNLGFQARQANQRTQFDLANLGQQAQQLNQAAGLQAAGLNLDAARADQQAAVRAQELGLQGQVANQGVEYNLANLGQQAQVANQAAGLQAANLNQQARLANQDAFMRAQNLGLQGQQLNQAAGLQAAGLNLNAAQQMAGLSDAQRRQYFGDAALLEQVGGTQQAQQQRELDDALARWQEAQNYDLRNLGILTSTAGAMPTLGGTSMGTQRPSQADTARGWISGIGSLMMLSDENMKSGRKPVSGEKALRGIEAMPVESWRYDPAKGGPDDGGARHIGPMAQAAKRNLGIGDGRAIPVVDAIGTQFAATQALAKKVRRLEKKKRGA